MRISDHFTTNTAQKKQVLHRVHPEYLAPRVSINPSRKSQHGNLLYGWLSYCNWRIRIQKISKTELTRFNINPGDQVKCPPL
jgi:hypothetical protein